MLIFGNMHLLILFACIFILSREIVSLRVCVWYKIIAVDFQFKQCHWWMLQHTTCSYIIIFACIRFKQSRIRIKLRYRWLFGAPNIWGYMHRIFEGICTEYLRVYVPNIWGICTKYLRVYVPNIWGYMHRISEGICPNIWGYMHRISEGICTEYLRVYAPNIWGYMYRIFEGICTEYLRVYVPNIWGYMHRIFEGICTEYLRVYAPNIWGYMYRIFEGICTEYLRVSLHP